MMESTNGRLTEPAKLEAPRQTNPFRAYVDLIYRRKWTIILVFLVVVAAVAVYNLTIPDVFMARAVLMIESQNVNLGTGAPMAFRENVRPLGFYQAVMGSRPFREQAIKDFMASTSELPQPLSPVELPQLLSQNLSLTKAQYLDFIELGAKAYDPDVAYLLCTVATQNLKNRCQEIEQEESQNEINFIEKQKLLAREKLEEADQALQQFREKANISVTGRGGDVVNQLADLENQLAEVQAQREMAEINLQSYQSRTKQMNGHQPTASVDLNINQSPEVLRLKADITRLEQQYRELTEQNGAAKRSRQNLYATEAQDLAEKLNAKKRQLVQAVVQASAIPQEKIVDAGEAGLVQSLEEKSVMEQLNIFLLKNRELYYSRLIENFKKNNPNILDRAMEFTKLTRAKTVYENLYSFLIERGEEAKIKAATGTGGVRIIDPPTRPQSPIPTNIHRALITAVLCGLALGLVVALAKDKLDNSFRVEEDVTNTLGLPVLGLIPTIEQGLSQKVRRASFLNGRATSQPPQQFFSERLITHLNPKDPIVEAYRTLRTNIAFLSPDHPIKKILVTSTVPSEGKTLTSANLAISFAEIGKKVVLVDVDLRRPSQHNYFNIDKVPGLTNCLYDGTPLRQAIYKYKTPQFSLSVLPAGKLPPNPVQTLTSATMRLLIQSLSEHFDIIIFDSPPLISVTDPLLLGAQVDGVLMIIKAGATPREAATQALGKLKTTKANVLGAALNDVDVRHGYGYYRYQYYYHYYDSAETEGEKKKRKGRRAESGERRA